MGDGEVGGEQAGGGVTPNAVFGPRAITLTGQRGLLCG